MFITKHSIKTACGLFGVLVTLNLLPVSDITALAQPAADKELVWDGASLVLPNLSQVPELSPVAKVVEQDDPERFKRLHHEFGRPTPDPEATEKREKLRLLRADKSLTEWERRNKESLILNPYISAKNPYLSIGIDIIDGERLEWGYSNYRIRGVEGRRTVYGPPQLPLPTPQSPKLFSMSEQVFWRWEVPGSLQSCLAWDVSNRRGGIESETMAVFFQPQKPLAETRTNPTLCYFGQKGLLWRKQVPIKEAVATLPEQNTCTYDVTVTRNNLVVSRDGGYIWVIASAIGKPNAEKRTAGSTRPAVTVNTFVFIYSGDGTLFKTLSLSGYSLHVNGLDSLLDGNAFLLRAHRWGTARAEAYVMFSKQGNPLFRSPEWRGNGAPQLEVGGDGRKIRLHGLESDVDKKRYTYYYDFSEKDVALAKPR